MHLLCSFRGIGIERQREITDIIYRVLFLFFFYIEIIFALQTNMNLSPLLYQRFACSFSSFFCLFVFNFQHLFLNSFFNFVLFIIYHSDAINSLNILPRMVNFPFPNHLCFFVLVFAHLNVSIFQKYTIRNSYHIFFLSLIFAF